MAASEFKVGDVVELDTSKSDNMYLGMYALNTFKIKEIEYDEDRETNLLHFEGTNTIWFEWRVRKVGEPLPPEPQNPWWEQSNV